MRFSRTNAGGDPGNFGCGFAGLCVRGFGTSPTTADFEPLTGTQRRPGGKKVCAKIWLFPVDPRRHEPRKGPEREPKAYRPHPLFFQRRPMLLTATKKNRETFTSCEGIPADRVPVPEGPALQKLPLTPTGHPTDELSFKKVGSQMSRKRPGS